MGATALRIDLHAHSNRSDGALPPAAVVARAAERGIDVLALTDHDTTAGVVEARSAAAGRLRLLTGIELTTALSADGRGRNVHLLGYFTQEDAAGLDDVLAVHRRARRERAERIVAALRAHGLALALDDVLSPGRDENVAVGRPHVAQALVRKGYAADLDEAFRKYLRRGGPGFVPVVAMPVAEGVRRIRAAGGAPVVAHPGGYPDDGFIESLVPLGLAGIEAYHPDNRGRTERYVAMAARWNVAATGGSDFHGHGDAKHAELGTYATPEGEFAKLERACR